MAKARIWILGCQYSAVGQQGLNKLMTKEVKPRQKVCRFAEAGAPEVRAPDPVITLSLSWMLTPHLLI